MKSFHEAPQRNLDDNHGRGNNLLEFKDEKIKITESILKEAKEWQVNRSEEVSNEMLQDFGNQLGYYIISLNEGKIANNPSNLKPFIFQSFGSTPDETMQKVVLDVIGDKSWQEKTIDYFIETSMVVCYTKVNLPEVTEKVVVFLKNNLDQVDNSWIEEESRDDAEFLFYKEIRLEFQTKYKEARKQQKFDSFLEPIEKEAMEYLSKSQDVILHLISSYRNIIEK